MGRWGSEAIAFAAALAIFGAAPVLASNAGEAADAPAHMEMTDDGPILVTPSGMTLYTNAADDTTPGKVQCTYVAKTLWFDQQGGLGNVPVVGAGAQKSCAQKWPPYLAGEHAQPVDEFAFIDRPEGGSKQWTYKGRPLYLSIRDQKPGERNGITGATVGGGLGRNFRLAMVNIDLPMSLRFRRREEGLVVATANDRPVYTPHGVRISKACAGCDEELFQPLLAAAAANVGGDWSIIDAGFGRHQYAFRGQPLYAAPDSLTDDQIAEAGGWDTVVFRKSPGTPHEIDKRMSIIGYIYTTKDGRTLYTFNCTVPSRDGVRCDDPGDPAGYWVALCGNAKECARRWHPLLAAANAHPVGEWSVIDVAYPMFTENTGFTYPPGAPRVKAWAYRGMPLYTYYEDKEPGDIWGHNIKWLGGSNFTAMRVPGHDTVE